MKTLQLYMYGLLFCIMSMSMGFPDIILEKDLPRVAKHTEVKKIVTTARQKSVKETAYCTKAEKPVKKAPAQQKSGQVACYAAPVAVTVKDIYLKLFDKKGNLLLIENIKVEEFLSKNYPLQNLPAGSKFVMFYGNTAYYYIENTI